MGPLSTKYPHRAQGEAASWHMLLSHFNVTVGCVPGKDIGIPDCMSRLAYPAYETTGDVSIHGDPEQDHDMQEMIRQEKALEKECRLVRLIWPEGMLNGFKNTGKEVAVLTETRKSRILDLFCGTKS